MTINKIFARFFLCLLLLPFGKVFATPITLHYADMYGGAAAAQVSNSMAVTAATLDTPTIMTLPQFDSSLGTLQSVHFYAYQNLYTDIITHCADIFYCSSSSTGGATTVLPLGAASAQLGVSLGSDLTLNIGGSLSCSDGAIIGLASCVREIKRTRAGARDLTFTGSDMAGFIGTGTINFVQYHGGSPVTLSLTHSGVPDSSAGLNVAQSGETTGTILDAAGLVFDLWLNGFKHTLYSDSHLYTKASQLVSVTYTYEPFVDSVSKGVPEPSTLPLMGLGLAGLGFYRKRLAA